MVFSPLGRSLVRERERESECVCERERQLERESVCVCVCERERERERERGGGQVFTGALSYCRNTTHLNAPEFSAGKLPWNVPKRSTLLTCAETLHPS